MKGIRKNQKKKKKQKNKWGKTNACFNNLVNFSFTNSFDLQKIFPWRVCNRFYGAETRIFKLLYVKGCNARCLELKICFLSKKQASSMRVSTIIRTTHQAIIEMKWKCNQENSRVCQHNYSASVAI